MSSLRWHAYAIAFLSGASVMVAEVAATRLLIPYFGASLFVWTGTISVILAALSFGYACAAKLAKQDDIREVLARATAAASIATAFIPYGVHWIGSNLPTWRDVQAQDASVWLVFSFLLALLTLLPAGAAYGLVSPLLIELLGRNGHHPGSVAGNLFAISTVGSIVGTVATGFILLPFIGTHLTYALVAVMMMFIAAAMAKNERRVFLIASVIIAATMLAWRPSPWQGTVTVFQDESPYQTIRIIEDNGYQQLVFNEGLGVQSVYRPETPWTGAYWDLFAAVPMWREKSDQQGLIIGYAGGTIARLWSQTEAKNSFAHIQGVEIDKRVLAASREFFSQDDFGIDVAVDDGRRFLARSKQEYDIIAVDAYSNEFQIPFHLTTAEFFSLASQKMSDDGILVLNVALGVEKSPMFRRLANTTASAFPYVYQLGSDNSYNALLIASDKPLEASTVYKSLDRIRQEPGKKFSFKPIAFDGKNAVFTDDRAPVELLSELSMLYLL